MRRRGDAPGRIGGTPVLPIATHGGGDMFLIAADGRVWRVDHETGASRLVAGSFKHFLDRLPDEWEDYFFEA